VSTPSCHPALARQGTRPVGAAGGRGRWARPVGAARSAARPAG